MEKNMRHSLKKSVLPWVDSIRYQPIRDLNYDKYFVEGDQKLSSDEEYNSHNTHRLTVDEIKQKLLSLEYVRQELESWNK